MSHLPGFSSRRKGAISERIAVRVLEELGFRVIETDRKIVVNNIEVGQVDAVVSDESGKTYAVEVKAGKVDVGGVRQAYVNAILLGASPLIVCKGFADDAARELAEKLGVRVIQLSDVFLVESEELYAIIRDVIEEALTDYLELFYSYSPRLKQEYAEILRAIHSSSNIEEAAGSLGIEVSELVKRIDEMKRSGVLPRWASKYSSIKRVATILLQKQALASALEETRRLAEQVRTLEESLKTIQGLAQALSQQVKKLTEYIENLENKARQAESKPG
ncbi:recombinase RecB [Thermogladius sp. 4427co]|uniref:recombinase RecB n=1 Tax=Thermogladius sp. 4427co TaxID=3450718 RepID=UPI003F7B2138